MKKIIAVLAAIVTIVTTFAFAAPAQASTPSWTQKDKAFVRLVRADAPWFKNTTARLMIESAHSTCDLLDTDYPESDAAWMMVDAGFTKHQAVVFVATAITIYCPWHGGDDLRSKPADAYDVASALELAKDAWVGLDPVSQYDLCEGWSTIRYWTRNEMASSIRRVYNDDFGYLTVTESRRVATRLLNWAC